jgi:hypothetical protein
VVREFALRSDVLLLVSCSNRKTRTPSFALMLRSVPPGTTESRATAWLRRLNRTSGPTYDAESLYAGDHWHVVRSLTGLSARNSVRSEVFVCSAGYGLISVSAKIQPYSATFALSHPDSVVQAQSDGEAGSARRQWWSAIASWEGPEPGSARSLAEAMRHFEYAFIALSPPYLDAIGDDLANVLTTAKPEKISIFSAGAKKSHRFGEYLIPCDSSLRSIIGGACSSLNIRCLRHAIERASEGLDRESVKRRFARLLEERPAAPLPQRTSMSDEEVTSFILEVLTANPGARPTPLLRMLRDSGRSCGQSRFSNLFRQARGGSDG